MNRRIITRVVHVDGVAVNTLIERDASELYWLTADPNVFLTPGQISIFDGYDAAGRLVHETNPGQSRHYNFIPPIHCEMGIFVAADNDMGCFTIAWRPKKWNRPPTMKADEIKHPEA